MNLLSEARQVKRRTAHTIAQAAWTVLTVVHAMAMFIPIVIAAVLIGAVFTVAVAFGAIVFMLSGLIGFLRVLALVPVSLVTNGDCGRAASRWRGLRRQARETGDRFCDQVLDLSAVLDRPIELVRRALQTLALTASHLDR